jgi:type I restriction-modification system DNA methylase subunit
MADQFREAVLNLLKKLPSRKMDALKQLFWTELNYEQINQELPTREWPESLQNIPANLPLLFATAGEGNGFHIIYCQLKKDNLSLMDERQLVLKLIGNHPYSLFIFSDLIQTNWHFVNVKYRGGIKKAAHHVLRRISIGPGNRLRTAVERISMLDINTLPTTLYGIPVAEIQRYHDEAFDVEAVTRQFFTRYREIFQSVEASLPLTKEITPEKRRMFTQRFFNRLMFLTFLERKGWLSFKGEKEYLQALMIDYISNESDKCGGYRFHRSRLNTLFFNTLNNDRGQNRVADPDYAIFRQKVGDAPYLNGGLFEKDEGDDQWFFPDTSIVPILTDLFYVYNFTIAESTPLDIEVAVDPEMLGKIFEELVTGRHETGSYYTPKAVVAFMCREALMGYLQDTCPVEDSDGIRHFIEERDSMGLHNPEAILEALRQIKVCDPACGSGAYLLGMMHELLDLRAALFQARKLDAASVYQRKLEIIQNNLYGVDKDPFAVNIARLRLWLSLVVDDERNPLEDPNLDVSLPNLDFKIEVGDSLTAPDPSGGLELGFRAGLVDDFLHAKEVYLRAHGTDKRQKLLEAQSIEDEIKRWAGRSQHSGDFDWAIEFAEVFTQPEPTTTFSGGMAAILNQTSGQIELPVKQKEVSIGFDIVLANPPYVRADAQFNNINDEQERQERISEWKIYRRQLKDSKIYLTLYEKWDLYIPFLERAYQLLRVGGQMVFIISDAYNVAKYTQKVHEFFLRNTRVMRVDFCSDIDLFDAGVNNTILHFEKDIPSISHQPTRVFRWGKRDEFDDNQQNLETLTQEKFGEALFRVEGKKKEKSEEYVTLEKICYISVGMVIHADERKAHLAFKANELISDTKDTLHPYPFVEGKDLIKWVVTDIHYLEYGTKRAPALFRRPTFPGLYKVDEKLISMDLAGEEQKVVYDDNQLFHNHSAWSFVPWHLLKNMVNNSIKKAAKYRHQDPLGNREKLEEVSCQFNLKYVLAIMNSSYALDWLKYKRRSKMHIYPNDWKQLPIAPIFIEEQKPFVELVDKILAEFHKHGYPLPAESTLRVKNWELELDEMVTKLYI